ncbi:MAG: hypothetical protein ACYC6A_00210 [Armatimonadota bacterium]
MNAYRFFALHYPNANGTDFTIGLAYGHNWCGGIEYATHKIRDSSPGMNDVLTHHWD